MKLQDVAIRHKISILVALPLIGLLIFSGIQTKQRLDLLASSDRLVTLIDLAPAFSALVHELQKERGMSAGFIASKRTRSGNC